MCDDTQNPSKTNLDSDLLRESLHLPNTQFPLRPSAAKKEPELLELWDAELPYAQLVHGPLSASQWGTDKFVLHDGPPYANGHLHMGHALNKILKDMIVRSKRMSGYDARFRPGWDCHGLPIEWKVEEEFRAKGLNKDDVPVLEFRQACRDYARGWVQTQKEEFKRLGVAADWENPYLTMNFDTEAAVAREFMTFMMSGLLYQGSKPVMWSPVEQTALAEAEVEYKDRKSTAAYVAYKVVFAVDAADLHGASVVAWTTTPWTLPSSVAVSFGPDVSYGLYAAKRKKESEEETWVQDGAMLVLSMERAETVASSLRVDLTLVRSVKASELSKMLLSHPLREISDDWCDLLPCVEADHVTDNAGTGLVHTAPSHGEEDYKVGKRHKLPMTYNLTADGKLRDGMALFGGMAVVETDGSDGPANEAVLTALRENGTLLGRSTIKHSYPHSWRSKAPVLYRNTEQWFVSVDRPMRGTDTSLRDASLRAMDDVVWTPASSKNRLASMVKARPDWLLSRQRSWGVPLTLFTRKDLTPDDPDFLLMDEAVNARVLAAFEVEGADAWYQPGAKARFLGDDYDDDLFEQCFDVLDVWFESGASHAFALDDGEEADLYVEGTDQHRGWFQSSLLHGVATKGKAPFKQVLTHGFALDGKGRKMSKSEGNTVEPSTVLKEYGADVMRLWVALSDHSSDFRAGKDALRGASDAYKKVRNTVRFMLGVLGTDKSKESYNYTPSLNMGGDRKIKLEDMPLLERWILHRLAEVSAEVRMAYDKNDFGTGFQLLHDFCSTDLSAIYLNVRKDVLYCDAEDSDRRQAALAATSICLDVCLSFLSPVLAFMTEEAWQDRQQFAGVRHFSSVHQGSYPDMSLWLDYSVADEMEWPLALRDLANGAVETARSQGMLTNQMHAHIAFEAKMKGMLRSMTSFEFTEFLLAASVTFADGAEGAAYSAPGWDVTATVVRAGGDECVRCRQVLHEELQGQERQLCARCDVVMQQVAQPVV